MNRKITRKNRIAAPLRSSAWQKPAGLFAFDLAAVGSGGFCRERFFRPSGEPAGNLHWYKPWDKVLDDSNPPFYRCFPGGVTNTCYNALDRHVDEGRGNQTAVIYDSLQPVTKKITDLLHEKGFLPILRPLNQMRE